MRIGIDLFTYDPEYSGGVNTFINGLCQGVVQSINKEDSIVFIVSQQNEAYLKAQYSGEQVFFLSVSTENSFRFANRVLSYMSWLLHNFKLRYWYDKFFRSSIIKSIDSSVDVMIGPSTLISFYSLKAPVLLCIHDIQHEYLPHFFSFRDRLNRWSSYRLSCWAATYIQVSSNYIKDCIVEKFSFVKPEQFFLAYEGVDFNKFTLTAQEKHKEITNEMIESGFVFYPAQMWPHKNHVLLIESLARFKELMGYELVCILTGYDYGHWKMVEQHIQKYNLKMVCYLGRVRFEEIIWLYRNCKAVLALGLHESSSLPVREGALFGKPLICSNIPPNVEAQEILNLSIVDSINSDDLSNKFIDLVKNESFYIEQGKENIEHVKQFNWKPIAERYLERLKSI